MTRGEVLRIVGCVAGSLAVLWVALVISPDIDAPRATEIVLLLVVDYLLTFAFLAALASIIGFATFLGAALVEWLGWGRR